MTYVYANLLGEWHCLNDDDDCVMGSDLISPAQWWEEGAKIWAPIHREKADEFYQFPYINIHYNNVDYRISPYHLQIVTK